MLWLLDRFQPSERKLRLFACTCCRAVWPLLTDERSRRAVEVAELYAEGHVGEGERSAGQDEAAAAALGATPTPAKPANPFDIWYAAEMAKIAAADRIGGERAAAVASKARDIERLVGGNRDGSGQRSDVLRCLFASPFRPTATDASWLTPTVLSIAQGIYTDQAFDRLPILADALQDAGCEDAELLNHYRSGGPHVRGCWAVDLVLGKE
jgi:hypothetical protein